MMEPTLLFSALLSLITGGICIHLGRSLSGRHISSSSGRTAWRLFTIWWLALGVSTILTGCMSLLGALGMTDLALFVTLNQINLLAICISLFGLLYYLIYVFTGSDRALYPLAGVYVVYYAALVYYLSAGNPIAVSVERWRTSITYEHPLQGPLYIVVLLLLIFPQILAALAYLSLYFRIDEPTQRYRILLVSGSILIWFGSSLIGSFAGLSAFDWWQVATKLIPLGAALAILAAYFPPVVIRARYRVLSLREEPAA